MAEVNGKKKRRSKENSTNGVKTGYSLLQIQTLGCEKDKIRRITQAGRVHRRFWRY